MDGQAVSRSLRRSALGLFSIVACAATSDGQSAAPRSSMTLTTGAPRRLATDAPATLGQRRIAAGTRPAALLSLADSVVRAWGWQVASVDRKRAAMRTDWLYFTGTELSPNAGRSCEDAAVVGVRLEIALRQPSKDSADFVVRGEAHVIDGRDRAAAERFARRTFDTIGSQLQDASQTAASWPDVFPTELKRVSGEVMLREGERARGCVTVRP